MLCLAVPCLCRFDLYCLAHTYKTCLRKPAHTHTGARKNPGNANEMYVAQDPGKIKQYTHAVLPGRDGGSCPDVGAPQAGFRLPEAWTRVVG